MHSLIERLLRIRIIRYGLVGGIGIPINDAALFGFLHLLSAFSLSVNFSLLGRPIAADLHFAIASACAFEVSNIINFVLNQFFTYSEQRQHIHGWEWVRRIAKGQLASFSALLLSLLAALVLVYALHVNPYLANPAGIIIAFVYNFFISNKLVFRPTTPTSIPTATKQTEQVEVFQEIEAMPK
ncbi:MAG: GtrA family protein [Ktedonobacteraceae bacterium]